MIDIERCVLCAHTIILPMLVPLTRVRVRNLIVVVMVIVILVLDISFMKHERVLMNGIEWQSKS
jgi:hypothetical protein